MPCRIGSIIKNHPQKSVEELKVIVEKRIAEKPEWVKEKPNVVMMKLIEERVDVDQWKNFEHARPWMVKDWDKEKHAKWLKLCEWMPIKKPHKFGKLIKENSTKDLKELKEIVNKSITEKIKPLKKTFDKDELQYFEILKEVIPNARHLCAKAIVKNKESKLELDELMAKALAKFEQKTDKHSLKKSTPVPKK